MSRVFIGIGSNEGDRLQHISQAVKALGALKGVRLLQLASIIETAPQGGPPQGPYLNSVVAVETEVPPRELLPALKAIETALGRKSSAQRWAPRPIDLDLLLYGDLVMQEPGLTIPHPRLHARRFVLEPLAQIAPDRLHPVLNRSISELLQQLAPVEP